MKQTKLIMGMPITIEVDGSGDLSVIFKELFDFFKTVDNRFSTYKKQSEISKINRGEIKRKDYSKEMKIIFNLAEKTKQETSGYFDIFNGQIIDPSGIVKGWAILEAAKNLRKKGVENFYIDAGGDVQVGCKVWKVGIKNPFNQNEVVKVLKIKNKGVATSGSYIRGDHIYDPKEKKALKETVSLTVVGPDILEADRFATAAFAMGKSGINFIENQKGFEGYMIDSLGIATLTSGFEKLIING